MSTAETTQRVSVGFSLRDYLFFSTVVSAFGLQLIWRGPFDLWTCYLILVPNCLLLLAYGKLVIHRRLILLIAGMVCLSLFAATRAGFSPIPVLVQATGFFAMATYHFSMASFEKGAYKKLFSIYCITTVVVASHAIVMFLIDALRTHNPERLAGIMIEAPAYVYATLPAMAHYTFEALRYRRSWLEFSIMLVSYLLADSSQGFMGIAAILFLLIARKSLVHIAFGAVITTVIAATAYFSSQNVQMRVDGLLQIHLTQDAVAEAKLAGSRAQTLETTNGSTLALVSNSYVSWRTFTEHPLIGTGLGTHRFDYEKYAPEILDPGYRLYGLNQLDANSLFLRLVSETGLTGLLLAGYFLFYFSRVRGDMAVHIRDCLLPYFAIELLRHGAYFAPENLLFAMIFVFNYLDSAPGLRRSNLNGNSAFGFAEKGA